MPEAADGVLDRQTLEALFESVGGDPEFLAELIDTYVADAPVQVASLRAALAAGDAEALIRPAHTLKSSSASLGAAGLAEQCRQLEQAARAGVPDGAANAVEAIAAEVDRVATALEQTKRSFAP
jgi:HPt (histidine-containing phosphotransfer) domain-containing protein